MISKIVICLSSNKATVGLWRLGSLSTCSNYPDNPSGLDDFRAFVSNQPNTPVYVIVDAVEEDFRQETMPHTFSGQQQKMVERKLNQLYRNTSYRSALFAGREPDKRRDDRLLFMALTNPDIITPWLKVLEELKAPLVGVYLLPVISQLLVKALRLKQDNLLLMTREGAGTRQSFFFQGHLRASRLTPMAGLNEREIVKFYEAETEKTQLYLFSQNLIGRETKLHLVFPTTDEVDPRLADHLEASQDVTCEVIPAQALAKQLGLAKEKIRQYPDLIFMHLLARQPVKGNLAPRRQIRQYQLLNLRLGTILTGVMILCGAAGLSLNNISSTTQAELQLTEAKAKTKEQEAF